MAEPLLPAGATVAAFVMTVLGWYAMVRTGIQLVHDDLQNRRRAHEDIAKMKDDLEFQENRLVDWKKRWHISGKTPDRILKQIWGENGFRLISSTLVRLKENASRASGSLGNMSENKERALSKTWKRWYTWKSKTRKRWYTLKFIMAKRKYVQELIENGTKYLGLIKDEADARWNEQKLRISQGVTQMTPEHYQLAHLLAEIAMRNREDAEELLKCCARIEPDVTVLLDLDVFDTFWGLIENRSIEQVAQSFEAEHLKFELLLRPTDQPHADLTRVMIERVSTEMQYTNTIAKAFKAMIDALDESTHHFALDASKCFRLTNARRAKSLSSRLRTTFLDILAKQDIPRCKVDGPETMSRCIAFEDPSRSRAAFELTQVCLLFARTSWLDGLCHCGFRCEELTVPSRGKCYHFGLDFVNVCHSLPQWRMPDPSDELLLGEGRHVWCTKSSPWDDLHRPIRRLGLLLLEVSLGTIVWPVTDGVSDGTAKVTGVNVYMRDKREDSQSYRERQISLEDLLSQVKGSFNNSDLIALAVEYCLKTVFPPNPYDNEWKEHLIKFYFNVVKPFKDIYRIRLTSSDS